MDTKCPRGADIEKPFQPAPCMKELYEGARGHDKYNGSSLIFWRPRGYREAVIMFFKGVLLLQALIILFYKIHSTTAAPPYSRQTQLSNLPPDSWQKYVRAPSSSIIKPVGIISSYTSGNVTNPDGLITGQGITLTRPPPPASNVTTAAGKPFVDIQPQVVVDFGQNYAGFLSIDFGGASGSSANLPGVRLAFSETLQYLTNVSDFSRSDNVNSYPATPFDARH
jgi:hypothetical protein